MWSLEFQKPYFAAFYGSETPHKKNMFIRKPKIEKDLIEIKFDTNKGELWFGAPNYYNQTEKMILCFTNGTNFELRSGAKILAVCFQR